MYVQCTHNIIKSFLNCKSILKNHGNGGSSMGHLGQMSPSPLPSFLWRGLNSVRPKSSDHLITIIIMITIIKTHSKPTVELSPASSSLLSASKNIYRVARLICFVSVKHLLRWLFAATAKKFPQPLKTFPTLCSSPCQLLDPPLHGLHIRSKLYSSYVRNAFIEQ